MIISGVCLVIDPVGFARVVCILIGLLLAGSGGIMMMMFLMNGSRQEGRAAGYFASAIAGAVLLVLGIFIVIRPDTIVDLVVVLFGIFLILHSAMDLRSAADRRTYGDGRWFLPVILAGLKTVAAILMIVHPGVIAKIVMTFAGVVLIISGATGIINICVTGHHRRNFYKTHDENGNIIEGTLISEEDIDGENE